MKIQNRITVVTTFITGCHCWYLFYCPEEFRCHNVYNGPFAVPFCEYYCCAGSIWLSGLYSDGTPCWAFFNPLLTGTCSRGVCIPPNEVPVTTERLPVPQSTEKYPTSCDGYYRGLGYATNCTYSCGDGKNDTSMHYRNGTACINILNGKPLDKPGVCKEGECVKVGNHTTEHKDHRVYRRIYNQCPEKFHNRMTTVSNCNYYCEINGEWYYGNYTLHTRCQRPDGNGWCCRGRCYKYMWCQEESNVPTYDKVNILAE